MTTGLKEGAAGLKCTSRSQLAFRQFVEKKSSGN